MTKNGIDIIIPLYNGEDFIDNIIETLNMQTFRDFRAIFVDDGSTDNSFNLLQERLIDAGFENKVVHQENSGPSAARNKGIEVSDSKWMVFVDCDDKLDSHFLEYLYKSVTDNDTTLGYCGFQGVLFDEQEKIKPIDKYECKVISAEQCMENYYVDWISPCCLIIDRDWFISNNLFFYEDCNYCEDIPFITRIIESADRVSKVECDLYLYLKRQGSSMRSPKMEKYVNGINGFLKMANELESKTSEAAAVFRRVGKARYMLATLRKGAVQLPFNGFKALAQAVDLGAFKKQIKNLSTKQRIAGYIYLFSKTLFYYSVRLIFKD